MNRNVWFDDTATSVMGAAFESVCKTLRNSESDIRAREIVARRIIEAAKKMGNATPPASVSKH